MIFIVWYTKQFFIDLVFNVLINFQIYEDIFMNNRPLLKLKLALETYL